MKCIYCNTEKEENKFSLEHIFPTALGGKRLNNNLFKTRKVCRDCNSKMGLSVDAIFLKSFFVKGSMSKDYLKYIDFNDNKSILPFIFLGKNKSINHSEYQYCDYWSVAGGSSVFHFHNNYYDTFQTFAGGNPIKQKNRKTAGEAYFISATDNPIWLKKLLLSFKEIFKYTQRFSTNVVIDSQNDILNRPNENQQIIIDKINISNSIKQNELVLQMGFEVRFLAKVALALGENLLGNEYIKSDYAQKLQKIIFEKDINKIFELQPEISNFFDKKNQQTNVLKFIAWEGGHTILFLPIKNKLILHISLFGSDIPLYATITNTLDNYYADLIKQYPYGWVYIFIPQRGILKGAYGFPEYIAYIQGEKRLIKDLNDVENLSQNFDDLPPFILEESKFKK